SFASASALFSGTVSIENSGGFGSVRTRNFEPAIDLSDCTGIELRVKGDGSRYKFMLRSETRWDGIAYCASFDTVADEWITVRIPFVDLIPVFRAKTVREAGAIDHSKIHSMQLMLSKFEYDGALNPHFEPGFFQLQVESIAAYRNLPQFILVSSAGVTRPNRPDLNLEEEPPAVRMNDQLGGILTWKLRGEDVVRSSGLPYTIIRPCALTEESGGQTLRFDQGDNLKGKVSREDIAALCVAALKLPQACNVTFEVAEGEGGCAAGDWACLFSKLEGDRANPSHPANSPSTA
ncbi:MAG: NAD(P)H-binding protein, partial [Microcoleus sp. SIO2G3]|nr:NAD(P)H-binding protein [Microcoleus sp. SIO2G3]